MKLAPLSAVAAVLVLALPVAPVAHAETLDGRLRACAGIPEAGPRLACFDQLAAETTRTDATAPAAASVAPGAAAVQPAAAPALSPEQAFGRERSLLAQSTSGEEALREISATVTAVRAANDGRRTFELDNGQVWTHTETPTREFALRPGDRVTIRRGALSSFVLNVPGQPSTRVRRAR